MRSETVAQLLQGLANVTWQSVLMMLIGALLIYLAISKEYEPLLLLPIGAGAILAMASDLRIGTLRAKTAFLFTRVGLAGCDMGACAILPRIIGQGRAAELLYTGRSMSAAEGERWGFYNRLVDAAALEADALDALRTRLLPLATVITPNLPEAELLLGCRIEDPVGMSQAAAALRALGAPAVLLKGGHLADGGAVVDILVDDQGEQRTTHPRLDLDAHGTGCTLASAVAANLARGLPLRAACAAAADYVHAALAGGYRPGRSAVVVLDHFAILPGR